MKKSIKVLCGGLLLGWVFTANSQGEISLCEGSGVHCMEITFGDISLKLVKGKSRPEIIIKPNKS